MASTIDEFGRSNRSLSGDTADNSETWVATGSTVPSIVSNEMYLRDSGTNPYATIAFATALSDGSLGVSFRSKKVGGIATGAMSLKNGATTLAYLGFYSLAADRIVTSQKAGEPNVDAYGKVTIGTFALNTWFTLEFVNLDFTNYEYDVKVDGVLDDNGGNHFTFLNNASSATALEFSVGNSNDNYYVDDILLTDDSSPSVSESTSASVSPSVSESTSASVSPSVSESVSPSVSESQSDSPSISPSVSESTSASVSPSVSESVSPSVSESTSPSVSESASPSTSPSASESTSPSASPSPGPSGDTLYTKSISLGTQFTYFTVSLASTTGTLATYIAQDAGNPSSSWQLVTLGARTAFDHTGTDVRLKVVSDGSASITNTYNSDGSKNEPAIKVILE